MRFVKCPRCELNYMKENETMCDVCRRDLSGEPEVEIAVEICVECGENPVVKGYDLCQLCLAERRLQDGLDSGATVVEGSEHDELSGVPVSGIDEIDLDIGDDIPPTELQEIDRELGMDEELGAEELDAEEMGIDEDDEFQSLEAAQEEEYAEDYDDEDEDEDY